jgi:MFS family permease
VSNPMTFGSTSTSPPPDRDLVSGQTGVYRWYVMFVMMLIYFCNFVDRQIITILAPYIKADMALTDAQIGLLFGTVFALFYGVFGIPLAKLADGWSRVKTLSIGLLFWSSMTTVSGFASNFAQLSLARMGVGVGEASGSPAAVSLLLDYFPKEMRSTVLALFSVGIYLGAGASLIIGGYVIGAWQGWFGLNNWQGTFVLVGLPGVALALLVHLTIREPVRGGLSGTPRPDSPHPFRDVLSEVATMFPPWSLFQLRAAGGTKADLGRNFLWLAGLFAVAAIVTAWTDRMLSVDRRAPLLHIGDWVVTTNLVQWLAIALSIYASVSWIQSVKYRNPLAHRLMVKSPAFVMLCAICGVLAIFLYSVSAFVYSYAMRYLGFGPDGGFVLGAVAAVAGGSGILAGGLLADRAKKKHPAGRLYMMMLCVILFSIATAVQFTAKSPQTFLIFYFISLFVFTGWTPMIGASTQDLLPPELRGLGHGLITLSSSIVGLGCGPYLVGFISDVTGSLQIALLSMLLFAPLAVVLLFVASKSVPAQERYVEARGYETDEP